MNKPHRFRTISWCILCWIIATIALVIISSCGDETTNNYNSKPVSNGSSCTVVQNKDSVIILCPDGSSALIPIKKSCGCDKEHGQEID